MAAMATAAIFCAGACSAQSTASAKSVTLLDSGWEFHQISGEGADQRKGWMSAKVPGDVHLDLLANKQIPEPFYRDNEAKLQWIEKASWEYRLSFDVSAKQFAHKNLDLVFEGLDASCQVYVNEKLVLSANNMHRDWRVPVKANLHTGKNTLRVVFPPPLEAAHEVAITDPWLAKTGVNEREYIRKAGYEFGWDWGPRFVTSGIWRPVRLEAWEDARISDLHIRQRDVSKTVAHLDAEVEVEATSEGEAQIHVAYEQNGRPEALSRAVHLKAGTNVLDFPVEIESPKLWYPAGYGSQPLYEFTARVSVGGVVEDERQTKTGLRSVVLRRDLDKWGRSFEFVVNGIPVFAKGADVIPFDSFPSRVTTENYRHILESARDANMNMIRHWGGGYYGEDEFYSICDELGLMVWQDFMFGNKWQPGSYPFKQQIEAEATDQVRRLRDHPSIVLWSGNNETESSFSWRESLTSLKPEIRLQMWQDYLTEFSGILPRVVERLEPEIPYWPSSPSADYEATSDTFESGDAHDWSVWHQRVPFTDYEKHHYRFVSEYGFQSFPEMRTVESFTVPEDRANIFTPVMLAHQKNKAGNSIIHDYIVNEYPAEPKDFASFLYVSQVLQAEAIRVGSEHWRRSRPETMGAIFWQLNDCWPVASWASIDYEGRWKALQYYARRFYAPVLVSPHVEDGAAKFYVVSDKTANEKANLNVKLMDFSGKVLLEESKAIDVTALASKSYAEWPLAKLTAADAGDTSHVFVVAELKVGGKQVSRNLIYLSPTKELHLPVAPLKSELSGATGKYQLRVSSPVLARDVYVSFGELDAKLGDNYFDLIPGESVVVSVESAKTLEELQRELKVISLRDAFGQTNEAAVSAKK
jgi:beta-mannosidase